MNNLSWFIYFADILPNVGGYAIFMAIVFGLLSILYTVAKSFANGGDEDAENLINVPGIGYAPLIFVIASVVSLLIPSRETFYLIAGSEAGEMVVTSETGKEILSDIQEVIKGQLQALKPKGE